MIPSTRIRSAMRTFALAAALTALALPASAEPSATDKATAEALFDQGKDLMRAGTYEAACPKFAESQRLDPGVGTLLGLGECYERTGRITSAWATFREASALARTGGDARRDALAQQRYARLEPTLPKLVVTVKETPGVDVSVVDGTSALARAVWGSPLPVDPGEHTIRASAPGYEDWSTTVKIDKGESKTVEVPTLAAKGASAPKPEAPPPPPPADQSPPPEPPRGGISVLTIGAYAVGAVGLGVGAGFGLASLSKASDLDGVCKPTCPVDRNDDLSTARTQAWISNVGFAVGVVGAVVGTVSLLRDRAATSSAARVTPALGGDGRHAYAGVAGRF
jgi:hypothetical protein